MMPALMVAAIAFVGTHFLLSHPLRSPLVRKIGEGQFLALYSVVAVATLGWVVFAYRNMPDTLPFWTVGDGLWAVSTLLMLIASILLTGSLIGNPAFPKTDAGSPVRGLATGVFAVTRHPMLWSFAIWGVAHILVYPIAKIFIIAMAIIILALVGAGLQDRKKCHLQPDIWPAWQRQTSFLPFAAVLTGKARLGSPGPIALVGGTVFWLAATWAHLPLSGWAAGIWRWL